MCIDDGTLGVTYGLLQQDSKYIVDGAGNLYRITSSQLPCARREKRDLEILSTLFGLLYTLG